MTELALAPGAGVDLGSLDDLDRYLAAVAAAGFSAVSLGIDQLAGDPEGAARLLAPHGLRCSDVLALRVGRDDDEAVHAAGELAAAAGALGARHVLALLYTRVSEESLDRLGRCAALAAAAGARLTLEMPPIGPLNRLSAALAVVEALGPGQAALVVDTFHFFRGQSTWEELESLPLAALGYVQFDDALAPESDDVMHETTQRRCMPGDGELDLERFASTLGARGWDGLVSVEVLSASLRRLPADEFARRAYATTAPYWGAVAPGDPVPSAPSAPRPDGPSSSA